VREVERANGVTRVIVQINAISLKFHATPDERDGCTATVKKVVKRFEVGANTGIASLAPSFGVRFAEGVCS
jgi:hypothetical protein